MKPVESIKNFFGSTPIQRTKVPKTAVTEGKKQQAIAGNSKTAVIEPTQQSIADNVKSNSPNSDVYEISESPMNVDEFDEEIEKALEKVSSSCINKK